LQEHHPCLRQIESHRQLGDFFSHNIRQLAKVLQFRFDISEIWMPGGNLPLDRCVIIDHGLVSNNRPEFAIRSEHVGDGAILERYRWLPCERCVATASTPADLIDVFSNLFVKVLPKADRSTERHEVNLATR
jgi:hypothetical protein